MTLHLEHAWINGVVRPDVTIEVRDGRIQRMRTGSRPSDAQVLRGLTVPGLSNVHSHVFHRLLRGRHNSEAGSFWSWRDDMYEIAQRLDPDTLYDLGIAVFAEMLLAGYTAVAEFHYLHHRPDGGAYADPNAMAVALFNAAEYVGIRLVMVDTLYLTSDVDGSPPTKLQTRFSDGTFEKWSHRLELLRGRYGSRVAMGVHSIRAVPTNAMKDVANYRNGAGSDVHVHVSEQRSEVEACLELHGCTPVQLLEDCGLLGPRTVAIHGTHFQPIDISLVANSGTVVCFCPTTERTLGDGIGPSWELQDAGVPLVLGSDSHAVLDSFEEMRALELNARLALQRRGVHTPVRLLEAATRVGAAALGTGAGEIREGAPADLVTISVDALLGDGIPPPRFGDAAVFASDRHQITDVFVGGRQVVQDGSHVLVESPDYSRGKVVARLGMG